MTFAIRGVIEGFYGPPWSWDARGDAVDFLAARGFNAYLYAPKSDPLHRDRWREPYLPEEQERFTALSTRCRDAGIAFVFGLSPLRFGYDGDQDLARLLDKVDAAGHAGIRDFCLLVDDMPGSLAGERVASRFDSLAEAHAWLVTAVGRHLAAAGPDRNLWFVPLQYSGEPDSPYLRALGRLVPEQVLICWTGPQVCSSRLDLDHTRQVAATLRRPVLYWDNHPVNDGDMQYDPHLGPLSGRDPALPQAAVGLLANVALQPEASRIALATVGDYCADPQSYQAGPSWARALADVTGDHADADAVAVLAEVARRSPLAPGPDTDSRMARVLARQRADGRGAVEATRAEAGRLASAADRLTRLANARLRQDLQPWAVALGRWAAIVDAAAELLARASDDPGHAELAADRRDLVDRLAAGGATPHRVGDDVLDQLVRTCLWQASAAAAG